ncbi:alanine--tRNA ligase [Macadamia integrifolia]|uniref:alanine--tRNA ligase n=1 Tax=Macadamia integrifolia TaxID=60698 RepID=UPI001C52E9DB|nr:alanine--tRNA ligase [Macadamia integrifolia]
MDSIKATKLTYFDDMWKLQSKASLISCIQGEDGRRALILDSTIFHPQGGGQPSDTGFITLAASDSKFIVQDTRLKDGLVFHYGYFENAGEDGDPELREGQEVCLYVDEARRNLNSRLHSAGHLLDICVQNVGWVHLRPGKANHFPDGDGNRVEIPEIAVKYSMSVFYRMESTPRIVKLGEHPGCPCGGTHVVDISEIRSLKVGQIRTKKGVTKISYTVD